MASTFVLGLGKRTATDVHLQGMQDQLWHGERPVAGLAQSDELCLALAHQMRVQPLLVANRAFPERPSPLRLIIVTGKDPGLVGKSENVLDRRPQRLGAAAGKLGARRTAIRPKQRSWDEAGC